MLGKHSVIISSVPQIRNKFLAWLTNCYHQDGDFKKLTEVLCVCKCWFMCRRVCLCMCEWACV